MKQAAVLVLLILIGIGVGLGFRRFYTSGSIPVPSQLAVASKQPATTSPSPSISFSPPPDVPVELAIPALNVDTKVEQVGLDSRNRMDVPKNVDDVAWYDLGYKPGDKGHAVIDGHFDKVDGSPAVFYYISRLQNGNDLYVTDASNRKYDFKVSNIVTYPFDQLPLQDIFAGHDSAQLILITCSGTWDQGSHNYSTRTVVYSNLQ